MRHLTLGEIAFEHAAFTVESAPDLRMVALYPGIGAGRGAVAAADRRPDALIGLKKRLYPRRTYLFDRNAVSLRALNPVISGAASMAKGQLRGNKEPKKPKQPPSAAPVPATGPGSRTSTGGVQSEPKQK